MTKSKEEIYKQIEIEMKLEKNQFDFPDGLTADTVLNMDFQEILFHIRDVSSISFGEFIEAFVDAGGSLDNLTLKILDEIGGYPRVEYGDEFTGQEEQYMEALLALTIAGSDEIDIDEFVESIECLGEETKEQYYEALNDAGIVY